MATRGAFYSQTLLGREEAGGGRVVVVELQQHVLQPVSHSQGELHQLGVHAPRDDWQRRTRVSASDSAFGRPLSGTLTFACAGVVQVEPVSPLCSLQVAFGRKEVARGLVRLIVCPAHLQQSGQSPEERPRPTRQTASSSLLTRSKSLTPGGHSDACWHTHPGLPSASSLHVFPRLQGKLVHGSRKQGKTAVNDA